MLPPISRVDSRDLVIPSVELKPVEIKSQRVYDNTVREVVYTYNAQGALESTRVNQIDLEA